MARTETYTIQLRGLRPEWRTRDWREAVRHTARSAVSRSGYGGTREDIRYHLTAAPRGTLMRTRDMAYRYAQCLARGRQQTDPLTQPMRVRHAALLVRIALEEVERRRLSTPAGHAPEHYGLRDYQRGVWLVAGTWRYEYSTRAGTWTVGAAYLCGRDDSGRWAVRVPATCETVREALDWLTPRPIREALDRGLPVRRQGDMLFRPIRGLTSHDMNALTGTRHEARPRQGGGLTIVHPEHRPVILSGRYRWRAYQQTQLGTGAQRVAGD